MDGYHPGCGSGEYRCVCVSVDSQRPVCRFIRAENPHDTTDSWGIRTFYFHAFNAQTLSHSHTDYGRTFRHESESTQNRQQVATETNPPPTTLCGAYDEGMTMIMMVMKL